MFQNNTKLFGVILGLGIKYTILWGWVYIGKVGNFNNSCDLTDLERIKPNN